MIAPQPSARIRAMDTLHGASRQLAEHIEWHTALAESVGAMAVEMLEWERRALTAEHARDVLAAELARVRGVDASTK